VIISNVGCGGCISGSEAFLKRNTNDSIFFVFTNISSLKALRLRMGDKLQQKNVYVDENNDFLFNDERIDSYPVVLQVSNPKKVEWDFLESGNSFEQTIHIHNEDYSKMISKILLC
jgi:precorrin-6B methylase 1